VTASNGNDFLETTLNNSGTVTVSEGPDSLYFNGGTLNNVSGGVVSVSANNANSFNSNGGTNAINNAGTWNQAGNLTISNGIAFNNTGTVNVSAGTLNIGGSISQLSSNTLTNGVCRVGRYESNHCRSGVALGEG
jgi:hypothetical protein